MILDVFHGKQKFFTLVLWLYFFVIGLRQTKDFTTAFKETLLLTKTSKTTLRRLIKVGIQTRKKRKDFGKFRKLDEHLHSDIIRRTVYEMYEEKEVPTIASLHAKLQTKNLDIKCGQTTLRTFLKKIGFRFKRLIKDYV